MLSMFICAHYRQLFYDAVVTVTLGWHHRRWLMKYVTAQESQNKLPLLQQSATFHNIALKNSSGANLQSYQFLNLVYYSTARNIRINHISFNG